MKIKFVFTDPIQVQAVVALSCAQEPLLIGFIYEITSPNPILHLPNGFGVNGTRKILDMIDEVKESIEVTDDGWVYRGGNIDNVEESVG